MNDYERFIEEITRAIHAVELVAVETEPFSPSGEQRAIAGAVATAERQLRLARRIARNKAGLPKGT